MDELRIRAYAPSDLDACRRLWVQLTEWHRRLYEAPWIGGSDPDRQFDAHLDDVGPANIWVAEVGRAVVGLTGLIVRGTEGELEPLAVDEDHRNEGIGRALTEAVIAEARRRGLRTLLVKPVGRNALAIGFYHDVGFDILGEIELMMDLVPGERSWRAGERLAEREFLV